MDGKTLARIGAVGFVTLAITASVIEMNRPADRQDDQAPQARPITERDPLRAELARCGSIGEAGARDPSCLRAWAENRRRFLGQPASTVPPVPDAPTTLFPSASPTADQATPAPPTPDQNGSR
ncbi:MAG: putative entry exclusion protein TrbK-alt [Myxococcota bacterium]|jgi:conjugative transfer region protein TrbK